FYSFVSGIDSHYDSTDCYLLGMKQDRPIDVSKPFWYHFLLGNCVMNRDAAGRVSLVTVRDTLLDSVRGIATQNPVKGAATWVSSASFSPMAISPARPTTSMRRVAVCIQGGIFVTEPAFKSVAVPSAAREEDVIFGREGRFIYCLH